MGLARSVQTRQTSHCARKEPESPYGAAFGMLFASLEHEMHSQTDAQERHPSRHRLANSISLPRLLQSSHGIGEGAYAGQHDSRSRRDAFRGVRHQHLCPAGRKPSFDGLEIALLVINDGYQRAPLVEGTTPAVRGSMDTAWRKARPQALKAASMR